MDALIFFFILLAVLLAVFALYKFCLWVNNELDEGARNTESSTVDRVSSPCSLDSNLLDSNSPPPPRTLSTTVLISTETLPSYEECVDLSSTRMPPPYEPSASVSSIQRTRTQTREPVFARLIQQILETPPSQ